MLHVLNYFLSLSLSRLFCVCPDLSHLSQIILLCDNIISVHITEPSVLCIENNYAIYTFYLLTCILIELHFQTWTPVVSYYLIHKPNTSTVLYKHIRQLLPHQVVLDSQFTRRNISCKWQKFNLEFRDV